MDLLEEYREKLIRTYRIQALDEEGNLLREKELSIKQNDVLVLQFSHEWTYDMLESLMEHVTKAMQTEGSIVAIPDDVQLKVISINE